MINKTKYFIIATPIVAILLFNILFKASNTPRQETKTVVIQEKIKNESIKISSKKDNTPLLTDNTQASYIDKEVNNDDFTYDVNSASTALHKILDCQIPDAIERSCATETIDSLFSKYSEKHLNDYRYEYILARIHPIKYRNSSIHMLMASTWDEESYEYIKYNLTSLNLQNSERLFYFLLIEKTSDDQDLIRNLQFEGYHLYDGDDYSQIQDMVETYTTSDVIEKRSLVSRLTKGVNNEETGLN